MTNGSVFKYGTHLSVGTIPQPNGTINFLSSISSGTVEVMRLSRDGVWTNPDIKPDEVAQAVLNALDYNIKLLVQRAVEAEREACAQIAKQWDIDHPSTNYGGCIAAAIRSRT